MAFGITRAGKIYKFNYWNSSNDASPLVYVLQTDRQYMEGLNINYLTPFEAKELAQTLVHLSVIMENIKMTGLLMYELMMSDVPDVIKKIYRKYQLKYITSPYLVSNGITGGDTGSYREKVLSYNHPFIKYFNALMEPAFREKTKIIEAENIKQIEKTVGIKLIKK
jgi:hypothetical protein